MGSGTSQQNQRPQSSPNKVNGIASQHDAPDSRPQTTGTERPPEKKPSKPQVPPPCPPKRRKADVFQLSKYTHVDDYSLNSPPNLLVGTFKELIAYLTKNPEWDDMCKVRAIFRWVSSVDVYSLKTENDPPTHSPLEYFLKIQKNMGNHAHLVSGLCQMAGIACVIISGMNKSAAYEVGSKVDRKMMGAQWNAVYIDGEWRFIDAFWASACVVGKKSGEWTLVDTDGNVTQDDEETSEGETQHRVNEFYFLPDPDQLIWTHFPDEKLWQLLEKPHTVSEFENHTYIRERFYYLDMFYTDKTKEQCMLTATKGEVGLEFGLPKEKSEYFRFKYMLYQNRAESGLDGGNLSLERFVMFEHNSDLLRFALRFPVAGKFKMDVFGLDERESDVFDLCCTYLISCSDPQKNCMPLPDCPEIGWGPGVEAKNAGLKAKSHDGAIIISKDGRVDIKLGAHKDVRLHQLLKNAIVDEATLSKYAVIREENGEFTVHLRLPQEGEYAMKLYANDEGEDGDASNVLNYLIKYIEKGTNEPFPNITDGKIGKKSIADKLGVKAISNPGGSVITKDGKASVTFKARNDVELVCEIHSQDPNARKHMIVKPTNKNGTWTFDMDMPIEGEYSLNIFAREKGNPSSVYNVHSYLIESDGHAIDEEKADLIKDENSEPTVITETVETSEPEILIPAPTGYDNVVACFHRRHADDSPDNDAVKLMEQDGLKLFLTKLEDFGEYMMDIYERDAKGVLLHLARYQINRKPASELYKDDAKMLMEQLLQKPESEDELVDDNDNKDVSDDEKQRRNAKKLMERAMQQKDQYSLEKAIAMYESAGGKDDESVKKARRWLELLQAKEELQNAAQRREVDAIDKALARAKAANFDNQLDLQIVVAQRLRDQLARIEKLRHSVLNMDQKTIAEIRTYSNPPEGVHQSLMGAFLLLGHPLKEVKVWRTCQSILGKTGRESVMRKIQKFDPKDCFLAAAVQSKKVIADYTLEHIRDVSAGAATFFVWAKGMIEEVESTGGRQEEDPVTGAAKQSKGRKKRRS
ncbi:uncharacterized protein LOC134685570 isoform X1 [Mytilus trossulus]|uniref:uncharacterized protein LOC134685570 isoform X1 n=1 Tax=Mytilus trossulus TaxID=6551 RepID=UPI003004D394